MCCLENVLAISSRRGHFSHFALADRLQNPFIFGSREGNTEFMKRRVRYEKILVVQLKKEKRKLFACS